MEPQADWKKLTEEELIAELDKNRQDNFTPECSAGLFVALIRLVREGKATAWLLPNGEIRYKEEKKDGL